MTSFDKREKAFETKYAHKEKQSFDIEARCSKLFGLWAAELLGLSGADADTYAMTIVEANLEEPGFDDVLRAVRKDFDTKDIEATDHVMNIELDKALVEAKRQLSGSKGNKDGS